MKGATVVPNKLSSKELQQVIKDGFKVPTTIKDYNKNSYVLLGLNTSVSRLGDISKTVTVFVKDLFSFDIIAKAKDPASKLNSQKMIILHDPTLVEVETKKAKALSNVQKGKVNAALEEGKEVLEIVKELKIEEDRILSYIESK